MCITRVKDFFKKKIKREPKLSYFFIYEKTKKKEKVSLMKRIVDYKNLVTPHHH